MFYWQCCAHHNSTWLMKGLTLYHFALIFYGSYHPVQMLVMISLVCLISAYALRHHARLPIAISFHNEFWRCHYQDRIIQCDMTSGFVLGPFAVLKLHIQDEKKHRVTIGMWYWDIITSESTQSGNWNQLRTVLKYSQRMNKPEKGIWLSG